MRFNYKINSIDLLIEGIKIRKVKYSARRQQVDPAIRLFCFKMHVWLFFPVLTARVIHILKGVITIEKLL